MTALAKDREARFASMRDFRAALRETIHDEAPRHSVAPPAATGAVIESESSGVAARPHPKKQTSED